MKKFSKAWYEMEVYQVVGRMQGTEKDIRFFVTKGNIRKAGNWCFQWGYRQNVRTISMGKISDLSASQARSVNTFSPEFF